MSILTYPLGFIGGGKEFYNGVMENSLRLGDADSAYIHWTPANDTTVGTKWTASAWIKKGSNYSGTSFDTILSAYGSGNTFRASIQLIGQYSDAIRVAGKYDSSSYNGGDVRTTAVLRDVSAWYHIVVAFNSTLAINDERIKIFINGVDQYSIGGIAGSPTWPTQNITHVFGTARQLRIGHDVDYADYSDMHITDVYFIDGYALDPENFAEYKEGVWIPKAYAGPPPIVSDSSSQNNDIQWLGAGAGDLNYDEYYIGESSIEFGDTNAYSAIIGSAGRIESDGPFDFTTEDWTIDFWIKAGTSVSGSHMTILHAEGASNAAPSSADFYDFVWMNFDASGAPTLYVYLIPNSGGDTFYGSVALSGMSGIGKWFHISVMRDNSQSMGQNSATTIAVYGNGVLYTLTINSGGVTPTDNLDTATVMDGKGMTLFGNNVYGYTSQVMDKKLDELRIVKGDARPPRFYFGTNYGDQSGGVLPQRATSAHRFTDDERTILLVSGQDANNHARTVSLVDESGLHLDNVHTSNSSLTNYPTQDGVGKQFTLSGAHHTTKESFVGNTSSILADGIDDAVQLASGHSVPAGTANRTIDFWVKVHDLSIYGYAFSSGTSSPSAMFGMSSRGSASANHDWYFQGYGAGDFGLPKPLGEVSQDWQHLQMTWDGTTTRVYVDGVFANSKNNSINTGSSAFEIGRSGRTSTEPLGIYFDEFRASTGVEPPQIKWTHTQTAGAGNKDAYDVNGWRAHGHEFTDDNATSLLVHGDAYDVAPSFDGTADYYTKATANFEQSSSQGTIFGWVKSGTSGTNQTILSAGDTSGTNNYFNLHAYPSSGGDFGIKAQFSVAGTEYNVKTGHMNTSDGVFVTRGGWHSFALSINSSSVYALYIDGKAIDMMKEDSYTGANGKWFNDYSGLDNITIGAKIVNSTDMYFNGEISQIAVFGGTSSATGVLTAAQVKDLHDLGPNGNLNSATGVYTSTEISALKAYWGPFSLQTQGVSSTSTWYDQSAASSFDLTGASMTTVLGTPVDSSSANSIHHALVSGGGAHHTKAVTLKSDGTNGTSTTDPDGDTIYWCGSNSTVEFANSSSFNYGNTAIMFNGVDTYLSTPDNGDWDFGSGNFTLEAWVWTSGLSGTQNRGLFGNRHTDGNGWEVKINPGTSQVTWYDSDQTNEKIQYTGHDFSDRWTHVVVVREGQSAGQLKLFLDGILVKADVLSAGLSIGGANVMKIGAEMNLTGGDNSSIWDGAMDEIRVMNTNFYPRFYLGNQAPDTGATFEQFKYVKFDGTADYYSITGTNSGYNAFDFTNSQEWTVGAWIWTDSPAPSSSTIFGNQAGATGYDGWKLAMESGRLYAAMNGTGQTEVYGQGTTVGWQLVHGLFDPANQKVYFYKDGARTTEESGGTAVGTMDYSGQTSIPSIAARGASSNDQMHKGRIAQICVWNDHLSEAEIKGQFDLGLGGNWKTSYSSGMVGYWNFNIADGTDSPTTTTLYDLSGNNYDMTGTSIAAITTAYTPSNASKRLTFGPLEYSSNVQANTAIIGNTHYANTKAHEVTNETFGSFVDDEYTVLLLRGGHEDGSTTFYDGNTAAGATITFPAHSHSYGKTRTAELISPQTNTTHETDNQLGLHGTSIKTTGSSSGFLIGEDNHPGSNFDFSGDTSWCWEFWIYPTSDPAGAYMGNMTPSSGPGHAGICMYDYNNSSSRHTGLLWTSTNGSTYYWVTNYSAVSTNSWHHVILQHDSFGSTYATPTGKTDPKGNKNITMFINGINIGFEDAQSSDAIYDNREVESAKLEGHTSHGKRFHIGYDMDNNRIAAHWDEIRITKGIPRYTPDGRMVQGIVPNKATGAGTLGTLVPTIPYLRPTPFLTTDASGHGNRGYFGQGGVQLWIKSDTFPGDTDFFDTAGLLGANEVNGAFDTLDGWVTSSSPIAIDISIEEGKGKTGGNAMKVNIPTGSGFGNPYYKFPTVSGVTYTASVYVTNGGGTTGLTAGGGTSGPYNFYIGNGVNNDALSGANAATAGTSWALVSDTFAGNGSDAYCTLSVNNTSGALYWSDLTITAESSPKVITNVGHTAANRPQITTANSVTDYALSGGADGILFDATDYIVVPNHEGLQLEAGDEGNSDFTIEYWIRTTGGSGGIMGTCNTGVGRKGWRFFVSSSETVMNFWASTTDSSNDFTMTGPACMSQNKWHHVAQTRTGNQYNMIIDGVSRLTSSSTINIPDNGDIYIGGTGSTADSELTGYLDEIRISKMARYTGQGLIDSDYPNPSTEFGIQTEGTTYGRFDTQVTANTTYQRYNYQHHDGIYYENLDGSNYRYGGTYAPPLENDPFTIAWWQNYTASGTGGVWAICHTTDSTNIGISWQKENNLDYFYWSTDGSGWAPGVGTTTETVAYGDWHLCALTREASDGSIYFWRDGSLVKEFTSPGTLHFNAAQRLRIGRNVGSGTASSTRLSHFGIWCNDSTGSPGSGPNFLTQAQLKDLYFAGPGTGINWYSGTGVSGTNFTSTQGNAMQAYYDWNNNSASPVDNADVYDRSGNSRHLSEGGAAGRILTDTKLLIHSNTDLDGDTSIVDSSPTEHVIDRIVSDPVYANTGANRSSLAGASYNGISFDSANGDDQLRVPDDDRITIDGDFTLGFWLWRDSVGANYHVINRGGIGGTDVAGWGVRAKSDGTVGFFDYGSGWNMDFEKSGTGIFSATVWGHIMYTRSGTNFKAYFNGTDVTSAGVFGSSTAADGYDDVGAQTLPLRIGSSHSDTLPLDGYMDQIMFIKGAALTTAQVTALYGGGNANTTIGALGGLIIHEEYANTTTTANAASTLLLHSNNATHHSQGSRKFYNDTVNTAFYGSGTFAATPAAAPKGHEAAGYFKVTAASGQYKFQGNTHSSTIDQNPQLRLRRGYSYILDFSDGTNATHEFYFANSTANATGYAYGSGGTSGARPNAHLTGLFGTNTDPNGAPAVTWIQLTSSNYGASTGGTAPNAYKYIKYEVPTNAPKNLYYRCSAHGAMGNAVFVMEATEPAPLKVHNLPALKTSGWNNRDYNPSKVIAMTNPASDIDVIMMYGHDDQPRGKDIPLDISGTGTTGSTFDFGTGNFALGGWIYPTVNTKTAQNNVNLWGNLDGSANKHGESGGVNTFQVRFNSQASGANHGRFQFEVLDGTTSQYEIFFVTGITDMFNKWTHFTMGRSGTDFVGYFNGKAIAASSGTGAVATPIGGTNYAMHFGSQDHVQKGNFCGFANELFVYVGACPTAEEAVDIYMRGRAGDSLVANSALKLYLTSKSTDAYGSGVLYDSSGNNWNMRNIQGSGKTYHHIQDDRTANTALYFDGYSNITLPNSGEWSIAANEDFTLEAWIKPDVGIAGNDCDIIWTNDAAGTGVGLMCKGVSASPGGYFEFIGGTGSWTFDLYSTNLKTNFGVWHHFAGVRQGGTIRAFIDGVCRGEDTAETEAFTGDGFYIGGYLKHTNARFIGYLDGIRFTKGIPRYTSGMPTDGQSPHKKYDDGRTSNTALVDWGSTSTRRYYGINTHTYLQTTEYSTDANTVLMLRGDDAETANDGVNMYGDNGFHLEFKEVGAGDERDYNNFNTGVAGLGSDTSATQEFADESTVLLVRSRPNQANGSNQFINEVDQSIGNELGSAAYHNEAGNIFSVDANTANVSVSSGGTRTY